MYFFTATINSWQNLLQNDELKFIVTNSLLRLAKEDKAYTHGFVIMPNHIHILWTNNKTIEINVVENTLLKFTGHQFKKYLVDNKSSIIHNIFINSKR